MDILNELLEARVARLSRRCIQLEMQLRVATDLCDSLKARCAELEGTIDELVCELEDDPPAVNLDALLERAVVTGDGRLN